ncbi:DUF3159 domain-containing protein [Actinomycetaceae bacterium MB13-C1-2]|nr:DUF3159 domain-containing protein [Actinomycetaceae bacterium MB13-C1-2]
MTDAEVPEDGTEKTPTVPVSSGRGWIGQLENEEFSLKDSIGGVRGAVESLLPGLVFVVAYVITRDLTTTLIMAGGISVIFLLVRLLQRTPITQAFAGLLGVAIGVVWAAMSGRAENYFAWGIITNAAFFVVFLLSIILRRPLIAILIQLLYGLPDDWKRTEAGRMLARRSMQASWVWVAVFGIRLAAQVPLYFGEHIVALGTVKLILGLPLFALGGWLTWVLLRGVIPHEESTDEENPVDLPEA